jgi:hypothetical protein
MSKIFAAGLGKATVDKLFERKFGLLCELVVGPDGLAWR